jgi:hypothetical protein
MLLVKNWTEFQHYKDRNPPWIKLHRSLLDDYDFARLPDASKAHLMLLWLFASQNGGKIPEDAKFLQRKLGLEKPPDLKSFVNQALLIPEQNASTALADCKQCDSDALAFARSQEKRREEAETECAREAFEAFWQCYPRKVAKQEAEKAWAKLHPANGDFERIMGALENHKTSSRWREDGGQFIPHPATWLNQRRFDDELVVPKPRGVAAG